MADKLLTQVDEANLSDANKIELREAVINRAETAYRSCHSHTGTHGFFSQSLGKAATELSALIKTRENSASLVPKSS